MKSGVRAQQQKKKYFFWVTKMLKGSLLHRPNMLENHEGIKVEHIKVKSLRVRRKLMDKHCHVENKREDVKILRGAV